jgi:hypothetical protein
VLVQVEVVEADQMLVKLEICAVLVTSCYRRVKCALPGEAKSNEVKKEERYG